MKITFDLTAIPIFIIGLVLGVLLLLISWAIVSIEQWYYRKYKNPFRKKK